MLRATIEARASDRIGRPVTIGALKVVLRIPGSVTVAGTLQQPRLIVPPKGKSLGNILKAIGDRITGQNGPNASDADCAALVARALD